MIFSAGPGAKRVVNGLRLTTGRDEPGAAKYRKML